jgi:hypothetical protein
MYFLEAKREGKNKIEAVSWIKKMTEHLGKVKKKTIKTKYCKCGAMLCFFQNGTIFRRLLWYYKEIQYLGGNKICKNININSVS